MRSLQAFYRRYGWLLLPAASGVFLRCWGLTRQVVGGDELHAVRAALWMPLGKILVTYKPSDNCIPLTAFYRLLMDLGVRISELHLRAPILLSGFLALLVIPWWVSRRLARPAPEAGRPAALATATVVAWLLALSPLLVHFGRLVRSYMPVVLFGFLAVIAFERWYRRRSWWSAAAYVVAAALAVYFHLGAGPFVISPFVFIAGARLLAPRSPWPAWHEILFLGGAVLAAMLLFLVPAHSSLLHLIAVKSEPLRLPWITLAGVVKLLAGSGAGALVVAFWLAAARGWWILRRCEPALAAFTLVLVAGQIAGLLILSPKGMHQPPIMARYLLVTLPLILLWVALGLAAPWRRLSAATSRALTVALPALFLVILFATGPLVSRDFRESPFALRPEVLRFYQNWQPPAVPTPAAYRTLRPENPGRIVEYPWHTTWRYTQALVRYQTDHGRQVVVSPGDRMFWDRRLNFRNMAAPRPGEILATGAAYLVVHLGWQAEMAVLDEGRQPQPGSSLARDLEKRRQELRKINLQARRRSLRFERIWGPPDVKEQAIKVWDLRRIRAERERIEQGKRSYRR